jgi:hypothetical protein
MKKENGETAEKQKSNPWLSPVAGQNIVPAKITAIARRERTFRNGQEAFTDDVSLRWFRRTTQDQSPDDDWTRFFRWTWSRVRFSRRYVGIRSVSYATSNVRSFTVAACNWQHKCCRKPVQMLGILVLAGAAHAATLDVREIIQRSVAANEVNWKAAPNYSFVERDVETKGGRQTTKTYQVLMIEGSQYNKVIAINDKPLPAAQQAQEEKKLQQEIALRHGEAPGDRAKRVAKYNRERQQDHTMLQEMANAFDFKLIGEQAVNGRQVWVLDATPRSGYRPKSRDAKVLTGMRGKLWVDKKDYQWVKVEAEVFRPVSFGLFIARVGVGTRIALEQTPVSATVWLPRHFRLDLTTSILGYGRRSIDDEIYRDYRLNSSPKMAQTSK